MRAVSNTITPIAIACYALLGGCATVPPAGTPDNPLDLSNSTPIAPDAIRWPERYQPSKATFFVHNEIEIDAPPQAVWDVLIQAEAWPSWYEGATDVKVIDAPDGRLTARSSFSWRTMDLDFVSRVTEFDPPYRLSWESRKSTIQGYHAWLLVPTARGTRVITDESQFGMLASLQGIFIPNKLRRLHDIWLSNLKQRAEASVPR
ncbi:MAG TPA: SRPBCC domain-containing protein [Phycisphaerales bacterium]